MPESLEEEESGYQKRHDNIKSTHPKVHPRKAESKVPHTRFHILFSVARPRHTTPLPIPHRPVNLQKLKLVKDV